MINETNNRQNIVANYLALIGNDAFLKRELKRYKFLNQKQTICKRSLHFFGTMDRLKKR